MFLDNKYTRWYYRIIANPIDDTYTEKHHIIPRCLGGTDDLDNIIKLSARQHFICHLLLIKMVEPSIRHKLAYAAWQLSRNKNTKISSRIYEMLKKQMSLTYTGRKRKPFTEETKRNMSLAHLGKKKKPHRPETKKQISENRKGKAAGKDNPFYGKKHSKEIMDRIARLSSEKQKGVSKPKSECIHCKGHFAANMLSRYHGNNCKSFVGLDL